MAAYNFDILSGRRIMKEGNFEVLNFKSGDVNILDLDRIISSEIGSLC